VLNAFGTSSRAESNHKVADRADIQTFKQHVVHLAKGGMYPVVCGSMGEAFQLTDEERIKLFKAAREALDEAGLEEATLICGRCVACPLFRQD
jgi:dihydrodipicolinate synthase/N-acetylneuraminate lyase